jgi:hypothetical protein
MATRSKAADDGADAPAALKPSASGKFGGVSFATLLKAQCRDVARQARQALHPRSIAAHLRRHALGYSLTVIGAGLLTALCTTAWKGLGGDAYYVLYVLYFACAFMVADVSSPDVCLFGACLMYMLKNIISPKDTFAGLSNDSIVTIGKLERIRGGGGGSGRRRRRDWRIGGPVRRVAAREHASSEPRALFPPPAPRL